MTARAWLGLGAAAIAVAAAITFWPSAAPAPADDSHAAAAAPTVAAARTERPALEPAEPPPSGAAAEEPTRSPRPNRDERVGLSSSPTVPGPQPPPLTGPTPSAPLASAGPYPAGLSPTEDRALRVRHLIETRELVASTEAVLASGADAKLAAFLDEERTRLHALEAWAREHHITAAELTDASGRLAAVRAQAATEPRRP